MTAIWTRFSSSSLVRIRETVALTVAALTLPVLACGWHVLHCPVSA